MGRLRASIFLKQILRTREVLLSPRPLLPLPRFASSLCYSQSSPKRGPSLGSNYMSASSSLGSICADEFLCGHREYNQKDSLGSTEEEPEVKYIPVKAFFLCTSIDLKSMQTENLYNVLPATSRSVNYVALQYSDFPQEIVDLGVNDGSRHRYMIVFQYGSAVLFNIPDDEIEKYLDIVKKHATGLLPEMRKDDYAVVENPLLMTWMEGGPDYLVLKNLDADGIRIIGSVLGQSVALDYYVRQVDDMVKEFTDINRGMEKTGTFTMQRKKLFQLVGKANSNMADVIIKLGLFDRSEIAWRNANYAQILEYLREEYELTQRFGSLDFKLKFVEHNIHFLQEVLQNRRSDLLEWCIIILLTIENLISIYEIVQDSALIPS